MTQPRDDVVQICAPSVPDLPAITEKEPVQIQQQKSRDAVDDSYLRTAELQEMLQKALATLSQVPLAYKHHSRLSKEFTLSPSSSVTDSSVMSPRTSASRTSMLPAKRSAEGLSDSEDGHSIHLEVPILNRNDAVLPHGNDVESDTEKRSSMNSNIGPICIYESLDEKETIRGAHELPKKTGQTNPFKSFLARTRSYVDGHFILTRQSPHIVLPRAPNDQEKYGYVNTRRPIFLAVGLFAFLCASAGLWLFTLSAPFFAWYGPIALVLQLHILLAYGLGALARDFNLEKHSEILKKYPITQECPSVDVFLPVCKEPLMVLKNTWDHVSKLRYPLGKLQVHVLDDGALDAVKDLANEYGYNYIRRDNRPYYRKAGNLRHAYEKTSGDFFVIFDADFCPRDDYLLETIPRMLEDEKVAILQTPQYFKTCKENTWVERGASEVQELFYRWSQVNRDRWNASICVGSNALYRREALAAVGGTALVGASEDVHTGFFAITRGWTLRYMPLCLAAGISPDTPRACFSQQIRWSQGSTSLLLNGDFHKAKIGFMSKLCFLSGMLYYWTTSISMFTQPLPGILIVWARPEMLKYYNLAFALPSVIYALLVYRFWSSGSHSIATEQIHVLQGYAYLFGIKDRIFGKTHEWISSGADAKQHKKKMGVYENARITAICWTACYQLLFAFGVGYRVLAGRVVWYEPLPQIALYAFNLYVSLPFLLSP